MTRDELQRLIDVIVQELSTVSPRSDTRCACHSVSSECCPDRLRGVIDAGASRVGVHAVGGAPATVASMIDHTLLKPDATRKDIEDLCREAAQFSFATVCVNPTWVSLAARLLYPNLRQTAPENLPNSPVIGTDAPVQYEQRDDIGAPRRRLPVRRT